MRITHAFTAMQRLNRESVLGLLDVLRVIVVVVVFSARQGEGQAAEEPQARQNKRRHDRAASNSYARNCAGRKRGGGRHGWPSAATTGAEVVGKVQRAAPHQQSDGRGQGPADEGVVGHVEERE